MSKFLGQAFTICSSSLQIMYSNTKTLAAIAVASLVDKGIMDYEDRITKVKES